MPDLTKNSLLPIAVLGAGAWGTALALHLSRNGQPVRLWAYKKAQAERIRYNTRIKLDQALPASIFCSHDLQAVISGARDILIVVPSTAFRTTIELLKTILKLDQRLVLATKGLDEKKHLLLHQVVSEILGNKDLAVISGPSFAKEVAIGLPTAVTIASNQEDFAKDLLIRFQNKNFCVELTNDITGVEIGGAVKNIIAIGIGIAEGLGYGANAKAALITQGLREMTKLGICLGAQQATFFGLSGLGDLVLTCTDNQSRNRRLGLAIGMGQSLDCAKNKIGTIEGAVTAKNIFYILKKYQIKAQICEAVFEILYEKNQARILFENIFNR